LSPGRRQPGQRGQKIVSALTSSLPSANQCRETVVRMMAIALLYCSALWRGNG
jgi:hypothetical protein